MAPRRPKPKSRPRRVAVVTGTRAEFGLLEPILRAMDRRPTLEPHLIVTGMHLLRRFGHTIDAIRQTGRPIAATVRMQTGRDDPAGEPIALAKGIAGIARALDRLDCEIVLVLGDRIEALAGASAGAVGRRVVAHVHGGDRAVGDIDDALRNAISRLAHLHLTASADASDRLRRMGEPASRIHRVGAPGLDDIGTLRRQDGRVPRRTDRRLAELLGPVARAPYAVVVQHPRGRTPAEEADTMQAVVGAVDRLGLNGVVIHPNCDPGHRGILDVIEAIPSNDRWRGFRSLPREDYLTVVIRSNMLVGNSSSGIIESASLGVRAVNVGPRQQGRLRSGPSVIDAGESVTAITRALRRARNLPRPPSGRSVYGDGQAGPRIARILERLIISPALRQKRLAY